MHETPLLFDISDEIGLDYHRIRVLGHATLSYWRGFWDEFWGIYRRDKSLWSWRGALDFAMRKLALCFAFVDLASASLLGIALRVAAGRLARCDIDAPRLKS